MGLILPHNIHALGTTVSSMANRCATDETVSISVTVKTPLVQTLVIITLQVTVSTPNHSGGVVTKQLDTKLEKVGRALAGGHIPTIAKAVYANPDLNELLKSKCLSEVGTECSTMCKIKLPNINAPSMFRKIPVDAISAFSWRKCIRELELHAPTLLQMLLVISTHTDHRNATKKDESHFPGICMAVACILKERNKHMCGIQSIISLILFRSCTEKKVCTLLHVCHKYMYGTDIPFLCFRYTHV